MSNKILDAEKVDYIRLFNTESVGYVIFYRLLSKWGSAARALEFLERERKIKTFPKSLAEAEFEKADKLGIKMSFFCDEDYPFLLKQIYDVPPVLYVRGNMEALNHNSVAVVGSRNASINSKNFTSILSRDLVSSGWTVVSGMAIGIDTNAHIGAFMSPKLEGKKTVAVLAGGVDNIYPESNAKLYEKIIEGGAVVSEMRIGTSPQASLFPRRNRIISGLSLGTVIMEASAKSGSLITARFAMEQGREVFAVPNFPLDSRAGGTNNLIKNGAYLVGGVEDIVNVLKNINIEDKIKKEIPLFDNVNEERVIFDDDVEIVELEAKILSLLNSTPVSVNNLIRELSEYTQSQIANALLSLELEDKVAYPSVGQIIIKL